MTKLEENHIDKTLLQDYRANTTVSGIYLDAWNKFIKSDNDIPQLDNYLITFSEDENDIIIFFSKPKNKPLPGGAGGQVRINKKLGTVGKLKLSR